MSGAKRSRPRNADGARVRLDVLGAPRLYVDGVEKPFKAPPLAFPLLATLVLAGAEGLGRDVLAARLWPERLDEDARADLRRHVHYIERALREAGVHPTPIARQGKTLRIGVPIDTDVAELERRSRIDADLERAVALYRGDLLEGRGEWLRPERERLREAHLANVARLVDWCAARADLTAALHWASRLERAEPLREDFTRKRLRLLFASGDPATGWSVYRGLEQRLRDELNVAPSDETVRLMRTLAHRNDRRVPLPPPEATRFFGRESDLLALSRLVAQHAIVTCVGSPGVGKTRLARRLASSVEADFAGGVVWLTVGYSEQTGSIDDALRAAVQTAGGRLDVAASDAKRAPEFLVVLDNCEQYVAQCAQAIVKLRRGAPQLHFLTTSRSPLGIPGELLWRVRPFTVPSPAIDLFVDRAHCARADFNERLASREVLASICRRLDGVPLALEVAAARLRSMSIGDLSRRLGEGVGGAWAGGRPGSESDALSLAFAMSYRLMDEREQALFRVVAIFNGGWTVEAAHAVGGDLRGSNDEWSIVDLLARLVDRSLVVPPAAEGRDRRYMMLQSLRDFALVRAREAGEFETLVRRHAAFFGNRFVALMDELVGPASDAIFPDVERDRDNINAALQALLVERTDPALGMRLCNALVRFWYTQGHVREGEHWTRIALHLEHPDAELRRRLLVTHAITLRNQSDYRNALGLFLEARALAARAGLRVASATLGLHAADCERTLGDYAAAARDADEAFAALEDVGERYLLGHAFSERALIATDRDELADAVTLHRASLAIFEGLEAGTDVAVALANLAQCAVLSGDADTAQRLATESLGRAEIFGARFVAAGCRLVLGEAALARGDLPASSAQLRETLTLALELNDAERCSEAVELGAHLFSALGKHVIAARLCGAADALRDKCGARRRPRTATRFRELIGRTEGLLGESVFDAERLLGRTLPVSAFLSLFPEC